MITQQTYASLVASYSGTRPLVPGIVSDLLPLWIREYRPMNPRADLVTVDTGDRGSAYTYLFDIDLGRAVVAYGIPKVVRGSKEDRDPYRQRAPYKDADIYAGYDCGHLMVHTTGGSLDINAVPQLAKVNRGAFRELEIEVARLAAQFMQFLYAVRLAYDDDTMLPAFIDQCIIFPTGRVEFRRHSNR